jgi:hypothetical protein
MLAHCHIDFFAGWANLIRADMDMPRTGLHFLVMDEDSPRLLALGREDPIVAGTRHV